MIKCPFCHFDNEDGALFCERCTSDLTAVAAAPPPPVKPAAPAPIPVAVDPVPLVADPWSPQGWNDPVPMAQALPVPDPLPAQALDLPQLTPMAAPPMDFGTPYTPPLALDAIPVPVPVPEVPIPAPVPVPVSIPAPVPQPVPVPVPMPAPQPMGGDAAPGFLPHGAQPKLLVLRGQKRNVEYPVYEGLNFVGRADDKPVDIDLEEQEPPDRIWCSRQHACISYEDNQLQIEDLNSANGTYVNRVRVYPGQKRPLAVNDIVQIGNVQMKVLAAFYWTTFMVQTCKKCSRANPPEAVYCYYDGLVLGGHERRGGPVHVGAQPFNSPFVFPTGRSCRSFDELALACQEDWATACQLFKDGYLENFLGGLGRVDLVLAAKEARKFPDVERGLDQLLAKLPSGVLAEPELHVDPQEVNLGLVESGKNRTFDLELENRGMRLLHGTVICSDVWLSIGDDKGTSEKHFQFTDQARIPIHVRCDKVRAGNKPVEAKLSIQTSGGSFTLVVKAEKHVKPFPHGPIAGCKTPRQVAEVAQKNPKDVAPLFEAGELETWYAVNGWTYPVKIPAASGIAAIQQFFEALGLTKPPKVEIKCPELDFTGDPGGTIAPVTIEVCTQEKRPVFAHATSTVSWIEISRAKLTGKTATINLSIPSIPDRPGETLTADIDVVSNGGKHFRIPVNMRITGEPVLYVPELAEVAAEPVAVVAAGSEFEFDAQVPSLPAPPPVPSLPPPRPRSSPDLDDAAPPPKPKPKPAPAPAPTSSRRQQRQRGAPMWMHLAPALLLASALGGVVAYDLATAKPAPRELKPGESISGPNYDPAQLADKNPRVGISFTDQERFGVVRLDERDPKNKGQHKRLTAYANGNSNNTIIKIGESPYWFGRRTPQNKWVKQHQPLPAPYHGFTSTMDFTEEKIRVTQMVQIVPGQDSVLDTVLIYYTAENIGSIPQKVAIRFMLDTYIGANDGVPFTVPGVEGFVTKQAEYRKGDVPDYLEVVENPNDSKDPGTVARIGLRGLRWGEISPLEPERIVISRFTTAQASWDWDREDMGDDSCVGIYWPQEQLDPKQKMHVAMTYGLGKLDIADSMALSSPGTVLPGREFVVVGYVYKASKGQTVKLDVPEGLTVVDSATKTIDANAERAQVFWKVKATKEGRYTIKGVSGRAATKPVKITAQARSIFG